MMTYIDLDKFVEVLSFAERNFNVGNRVRVFYKGKWHLGTVVRKEVIREGMVPNIWTLTDNKVGDNPDAYFNGFGLVGKADDEYNIRFIYEVQGGDNIYKTKIERPLTKEEIKKEMEDLESLPF